jgi:alkylation response protein AidB-like acyl-CoA dehydrogenase
VDFAFREEQEAFRETLRRSLAEHAPISEVRRALETPEGFDPGLWRRMARALGLQGVHLPEVYGRSKCEQDRRFSAESTYG